MTSPLFVPWPKTPRLFRDMTITEKIDGTNAAVHVRPFTDVESGPDPSDRAGMTVIDMADGSVPLVVWAQSRNRALLDGADNAGFAAWTAANADTLADILGVGTHYGEWWGSGIQRGYGLAKGDKRFSLFNVARYRNFGAVHEDGYVDFDRFAVLDTIGLDTVPVLYEGPFQTDIAGHILRRLELDGSHAEPGYMKPEGIIVHHTAANQVFKALIENDDLPKGAA